MKILKKILVFCCGNPEKDKFYIDAITHLGFETIALNPQPFDENIIREIESADGIVFTGGGDIHSDFFNPPEPLHPTASMIDIQRDRLEIASARYAIEREKPIFATCRGMQVLNVALGGSLYQDIDDQFPPPGVAKHHRQTDGEIDIPRSRHSHKVILEEGCLFHRILKKVEIDVNSTHHQALKNLGTGLKVTGRAPDGVPETVEIPGRDNLIAVQFHPERMLENYEDMRKLFEYFAEVVNREH